MHIIIANVLVALGFLGIIILIWTVIQLWAEKLLGVRKQGCKGPVPSETGEMLCCKGDGNPCKETQSNGH